MLRTAATSRANGHQLELETGKLHHHQVVGLDFVHVLDQRQANISAHPGFLTARPAPGLSAMRPTRVVVVVFPAEPVMPITGHGTASMKICESLVSGRPRRTASTRMGRVSGTPPETQTRSASSSRSSGCPPSAQCTVSPPASVLQGWIASFICSGSLVIDGHPRPARGQIARQGQSLAGCADDENRFTCPVSFHDVLSPYASAMT